MSAVAENTVISPTLLASIKSALTTGKLVPCLGAGALEGVIDSRTQKAIPADSTSLILAMTGGQPMATRLMYEFPRAAMHIENKKGRSFLERFLTQTYAEGQWTESPLHRWLADLNLPYIIDMNRDTQLQKLYAERRYTLIVGAARLAGTSYRFNVYQWDKGYKAISPENIDTQLPILFKPLGSPWPKPSYIASDADFVDYITELMGGFAIPNALKQLRLGKQYLMLGMHFTRDTERMVVSDLMYGADDTSGWALIPDATTKEERFCTRHHLVLVASDWSELLA